MLAAQGRHAPSVSESHPAATIIDVACSLPVLLLASAIAMAVALLTRSTIATVVVTGTVFYLPLTILQDAIFWATPTRWVVEWLHLDPFGEGVDYIADNSPYDHRGAPAVAAGLLILTALIVIAAVLPLLVTRAVTRPNERNA